MHGTKVRKLQAKSKCAHVASILGLVSLQFYSNIWTLKCLNDYFKDVSVSQISHLATPSPHTTLTIAATD